MNGGGGGGGEGGAGVRTNASLTVNGAVLGGSGGAGGNGGAGGISANTGGNGGAGGIGVVFTGAGLTLTNNGSIAGGTGGAGGAGDGAAGSNGVGVIGAGLTINQNGTIAGAGGANAITFTGGTNIINFGAAVSGLTGGIGLTGSIQLNAAPGGTTLGSVISGTGSLIQNSPNTLTLAGLNTYTGATTVNAGTLRGGAANALSAASATTINGGGTLDLGGFPQAINAVALAGGTLRNGALTGVVISTGGTIDGLGGPATLTTAGGTTSATGVNTYTGATNVNGGTLSVIGSITASNITVNNGGTLAGTGKIGDPAINAGGTLAPGSAANPTGTLTIVGPLSFAAGSTYQVSLTPTANSRTNVTGTTTIGGGTVNVLAGAGTYASGTRYTILTATGGVTGQFTSLQTTSNLAFLQPSLSYDATDVVLSLNGAVTPAGTPVTFPSVAFTRNQRAAARGAGSLGPGNPIYDAILSRTAPEARAAFDALSGEVHGSVVTTEFETSRLVREAILDRLRGFAPATGLGLAGATVPAAFAADLPGGRKPELAPVPFAVMDPRVFALWGQGFGSFGSTRQDSNAGTLTRDTGGFIIGADATLEGTWRFGVAGGYTDTNLDVRSRASTGEVQSGFGALYGAARFGPVNLRVGGAFASNRTRTTRNVSFPGFSDSLSARYGGDTLQGFGEAGYQIPLGAAVLEPFVGGAAIHIDRDGFTERGGAAALTSAGRGYDVETVTAGLRASTALAPGSAFSLKGLVGYRHAFGDVVPTALLAFTSGGSQFTVAGVPIDRDAIVAEAGIDWKVAPDITLGLAYAGQAGSRAQDHGAKGSFLYRF